MHFTIGTIYRYPENTDPIPPVIDNMPNYFHYTHFSKSSISLKFQYGIHGIEAVDTEWGTIRRPAIIISSSPHKSGSKDTPWEDEFDPNNGYVRYYGDNKSIETDPACKRGNKLLLEAFKIHSSPNKEERLRKGIPLLYFRRVKVDGRLKGNLVFEGFGVIESAERVTQIDSAGNYFTNYVFGMCVFSLKHENEKFNWDWINCRRDPSYSDEEANNLAPLAWREWVDKGKEALSIIRRKVSKLSIIGKADQMPEPYSKLDKSLQYIYNYYSDKRHHFELLAMRVSESIFTESKATGWVTQKSSDGGIDFVARLDFGSGFSSIKLVVLGQAKCEKLSIPTNGTHIARLVARLKRGWIGVYVTTAFFSPNVQQEIIEDQYPIMLICGLRLVKEVEKMVAESGMDLPTFLHELDKEYDSKVFIGKPEIILHDF